jgi:hypothetical protein
MKIVSLIGLMLISIISYNYCWRWNIVHFWVSLKKKIVIWFSNVSITLRQSISQCFPQLILRSAIFCKFYLHAKKYWLFFHNLFKSSFHWLEFCNNLVIQLADPFKTPWLKCHYYINRVEGTSESTDGSPRWKEGRPWHLGDSRCELNKNY